MGGCPKASYRFAKAFDYPHQEEGFGRDYSQVYRYHFQDWSRSVPDYRGEEELYGSSQEATRSCFGCRVNFVDGSLIEKLISILIKKNLKSFVFSCAIFI